MNEFEKLLEKANRKEALNYWEIAVVHMWNQHQNYLKEHPEMDKPKEPQEIHCPHCQDTGWIHWEDKNGERKSAPCSCTGRVQRMKRLQEYRNGLEAQGLLQEFDRYTFSKFQHGNHDWRYWLFMMGMEYVMTSRKTDWFYICGKPGTGKTHIAVATCGWLIRRRSLCYMEWRRDIVRLKGKFATGSEAFEDALQVYKDADILYIDDFFKGKNTEMDISIAGELIDHRYKRQKQTIITSEKDINDLRLIDPAIGGRIYQMSRRFNFKTADFDWRMQ